MENQRIKVFLVDDDEDILRIYSSHFKLNGLDVVGTANNGFEALLKLTDSIPKPDVIVIDYHMPIINGIETSKHILKIDKAFKIIMMSGDKSIKRKALSNGIIDFYEKPFSIKSLCSKIKELNISSSSN